MLKFYFCQKSIKKSKSNRGLSFCEKYFVNEAKIKEAEKMANKTETARAKCPFYEGFGKQCIKCRAREDRLVTVSFSAKNGRSGALCRATYQRANCDVVQNRLEPEAQCPIFQALWADWERTQE